MDFYETKYYILRGFNKKIHNIPQPPRPIGYLG